MNAKLLALGLIVTLGAAGAAQAQSVRLSYGKQTRHGEFSVSLSTPLSGERRSVRAWVPGHYEQVQDRVWVEGAERSVWVPPVYETRFDECGRPYSYLARQGFWNTVREPGHFELRIVKVWVEGYWQGQALACAPEPVLDLHYERSRGRGYGSRPVRGRFDGYRYDGRGR